MKTLRDYFEQQKHIHDRPVTGDLFALNMREECLLESEVIEHDDESITLLADNQLMQMLESRVRVINARMVDIDRSDKNIILHDDSIIPYDTLVMGMGI